MKQIKKCLRLFLLWCCMVGMFSSTALAAETEQDGIVVAYTTDQESYDSDENIAATLTVTNTNAYAVTNVSLEAVIPEGYTLAEGQSASLTVDTLAAGESKTLTITLVPEEKETETGTGSEEESTESDESTEAEKPSGSTGTSGSSSQNGSSSTGGSGSKDRVQNGEGSPTGDETNVAQVMCVVVIAALLILLLLYGKKKAGAYMALFLAVVLASSLLYTGTAMAAEEEGATEIDHFAVAIDITETVQVDGQEVSLAAKVACDRPVTRADLQSAVLETAWAYYMKETQVQYDSNAFTAITNKNYGAYRVTEGMAPEYATSDTTHFSVCTYFCYDSYYNAFGGYRLGQGDDAADARTHQLWANVPVTDESAILRWSPNAGETLLNVPDTLANGAEFAAWLDEGDRWAEILEPGDVLVINGHATMYVGEGMMLECYGGKYSAASGTDTYEPSGAIMLNSFENYYLNVESNSYLGRESNGVYSYDQVLFLRPINHLVDENDILDPECGYSIQSSVLGRWDYPGIEIDRTVDLTPYGSAAQNGEVTYSIVIRNNSSNTYANVNASTADGTVVNYPNWYGAYYGMAGYAGEDYTKLPVTEVIPEGTTIVADSIMGGGIVNTDGTITWELDIPAGETVEIAYTVHVDAPLGTVITADDGSVAGIPSNVICNRVGGEKLAESAVANIATYHKYAEQYSQHLNQNGVANGIYTSVFGLNLGLADVETLVEALFEPQAVPSGNDGATTDMLVLKDYDASNVYRAMLVDRFISGYLVHTDHLDHERIWDLNIDFFEVGDVLVKVESCAAGEGSMLVYLGDQRFATLDEDGYAASMDSASLWKDIFRSKYEAVFLLRPSQAYADLNTDLEAAIVFEPDTDLENSTTDDTPEEAGTLEQWQKAIVETAYAYWRRSEHSVYSNDAMTSLGEEGPLYATWNVAPEDITSTSPYYGTGEYLIYEVFQNAVDMKLAADQGDMWNTAALQANYGVEGTDLLIADIAILTDGSLALYLGDSRYLTMTKEDGIVIMDQADVASVLRPLTAECDAHLTAAAAGRLAFPGLDIVISSSLGSDYATAPQKKEVTYTITVTNGSEEAYGKLEIIQFAPRKAVFTGEADKHVDGNTAFSYNESNGKLCWTAESLAAGETLAVSYTVTVKESINEDSQSYLYYLTTNGKVGADGQYLPLNVLNNRIGFNKLSEEQKAASLRLTTETLADYKITKAAVAAVRNYYSKVVEVSGLNTASTVPGIGDTLGIKTGADSVVALETDPEVKYYGFGVLLPVDACPKVYSRQLLVDGFYGGELIYAEQAENDMVRCPSLSLLEPGDYIMAYYGKTAGDSLSAKFWIYLGQDETTGIYKVISAPVGTDAEGIILTTPVQVEEYTDPKAFFEAHGFTGAYVAEEATEKAVAAYAVMRPSQVKDLYIEPVMEESDPLEMVSSNSAGNFKTVAAGSSITYTITVTNKTTRAYENLTLTETLANAMIQSVSEGASYEGNVITWNIASLAAGESVTLEYTVTVSGEEGQKVTKRSELIGADETLSDGMSNGIGYFFSEEQLAALAACDTAVEKVGTIRTIYQEILGNNDAYSYIGGKTAFVKDETTVFIPGSTDGVYVRNTANDSNASRVLVLYAGTGVEDIGDPFHIGTDEFRAEYMEPGDFLIVDGNGTYYYLYLGQIEADGQVYYKISTSDGKAIYQLTAEELEAKVKADSKFVFLVRVAQALEVDPVEEPEPENPSPENPDPENPNPEEPVEANLVVSQTADMGLNTPVRGGTIEYTVSVTNTGAGEAVDVPVTVAVTNGTITVAADGVIAESGTTATWMVDLTAGASTELSYTVTVVDDATIGAYVTSVASVDNVEQGTYRSVIGGKKAAFSITSDSTAGVSDTSITETTYMKNGGSEVASGIHLVRRFLLETLGIQVNTNNTSIGGATSYIAYTAKTSTSLAYCWNEETQKYHENTSAAKYHHLVAGFVDGTLLVSDSKTQNDNFGFDMLEVGDIMYKWYYDTANRVDFYIYLGSYTAEDVTYHKFAYVANNAENIVFKHASDAAAFYQAEGFGTVQGTIVVRPSHLADLSQ